MLKFILYIFFMIPLSFMFNWDFFIYSIYLLFFIFFLCYMKYNFFCLVSYELGIDIYSYIFICLSLLICLLMIYSMKNYSYFGFSYFLLYCNFLLLVLFIVFSVSSFIYFYFFFECSLIPVFLIIFGWGYQPERLEAGFFLIIYTLVGSFPFLLSIFYIYDKYGCFFYFLNFYLNNYYVMFFIIFSFLIKFPLFGVHIWLPKAHVEAPVGGSMILAGVMLKLGGYGFIRSLSFVYYFLFNYNFFFINLSLLGSLFISLYCLIQSDLKILIAYSSVCHMSIIIAGLFSMMDLCVIGGFVFMIGHGFISSGLFYLIGLVYMRLSSRSFFILKGLLSLFPSLSLFWFLFCVSNMSCPPSINLFSELVLIIGLLTWNWIISFYLFFILFFSACYSLMIFSLSQHGGCSKLIKFISVFFVCDFFVLTFHLIPVFFMILCMNFFFFLFI